MSNIQNVSIPIASQHKTKLDLSCDHLTTMNFMQLQPVYYRHMIKGEHLNVAALATARLMPMQLPILGKMRLNLRSFFVPWRLVFPNWDSFHEDVIASGNTQSSLVNSCPVIQNDTFVSLFIQRDGTVVDMCTVVTSADVYDFKVVLPTSVDPPTNVYIRLTYKGRALLKLLYALGYRFNWNFDDTTSYSALALLAYGRIYFDWYTNSSYLDSATILTLERAFKQNEPAAFVVDVGTLAAIVNLAWFVQYDNDAYFNAAWDNPMSPISTQQSIYRFDDISVDKYNGNYQGYITNSNSGNIPNSGNTSVMRQGTSSSVYLGTQYLHDAMKKLQNYSKRHQLSGARVIDRTLADWGFGSDALSCSRSIYIGSQSIDIDTGQVLNTAEKLGDYAGVGRAQGSKTWDYQCDEFGIFIVTASILPSGQIVQGMDRNNMKSNKFDFFQPALDSLAIQAISRREVYMSNNGDFGGAAGVYYDDGVFGFVGRYGEMKRPISWLTGDASLASFVGSNAWNLFRLFGDDSFVDSLNVPTASAISHSLDFTRGSDWEQYNRIFALDDGEKYQADRFIVQFHFDVGAYAPCKPLFETYDFEETAKEITLASQGSKVN